MDYSLNNIITALIPDNLSNDKFIADSIDIFLEVLESKSNVSKNLSNRFIEEKTNLHNEFLKVYLESIHKAFNTPALNKNLYTKLERLYAGTAVEVKNLELFTEFNKYITNEYIASGKDFRVQKGRFSAIEFIYNLIIDANILGPLFDPTQVELTPYTMTQDPTNNFQYHIIGHLPKEVFDIFIKPIVHPVGWKYTYFNPIDNRFIDFFNQTVDGTASVTTDSELQFDMGYTYTDDVAMLTINSALGESLILDEFILEKDQTTDTFSISAI